MSSEQERAEIATWLLTYVAAETRPERIEAWVDRVAGRLAVAFPDLAAPTPRGDDLSAEIRAAVREHWLAFLGELAQSEQRFHLVDAAVHLARQAAERRIPLETLTRIYRVAQQEVWSYVADVVSGRGSPVPEVDRADLLIHLWGRAASWLDDSVGETTEVYQAAIARAAAGAAAHRYESARAILDGTLVDPREASAALGGYPISVHHTAVVVSVADPGRAGSLETVAQDLSRRVRAATPLVVKPGGRQLWLWLATRDEPELGDLDAGVRHEGVSVGVGTAAPGIAGFVASHAEALDALRLAVPDDAAWLRSYADVELPVLLGCTPAVDRFVARTLGVLASDDDTAVRIRETLRAWLDHGGSAEDAARALVVHRNTVRYRMRQAEELLGRPVGALAPELSVALQHHELFHRGGPPTS